MSTVLSRNGKVLTANNKALTHQSGDVNVQISKSYTVSSSGSQTVSPDTGYDAMGVVSLTVPAGSATPASTISSTDASVSTGTNTITLSKSAVANTPAVSAGYVSTGTQGNSSVSLTANVTTKGTTTYTPTTTNQTIASGTYLTGTQTIAGDANLVAGNIKKDVTIFNTTGTYEGSGGGNLQPVKEYTVSASGNQTISPDTGYDGIEEVALIVPAGTATAPASISGSSASVSTGTNTLTLSKTVSVTPNVTTAGYISSGTAGNSSVSLTASVTTKASATLYPSTSDQTISSGTYLTGTQTIKGVTTSNLTADNIKKDVVVQVGDSADPDRILSITGTYEGSGGGATNFVTGTFITGSSTSTVGSLSITYSGSGYPIMLAIWVEGGCYNSSGASDWYNSLTRYAVGQVIITKGVTTSTPTYTTSGSANYGTIQLLYKNSTSQATLYSSTRSASANSYSSSNASGTSTTCVRWKGNKSLSYYVSGGTSSTYGLLASTTYRYVVYYSS